MATGAPAALRLENSCLTGGPRGDVKVQYILPRAQLGVQGNCRRIDRIGLNEDHIGATQRRDGLQFGDACCSDTLVLTFKTNS